MLHDFIPSVEPPKFPAPSAYWFVFSEYRLLVAIPEKTVSVPTTNDVNALNLDVTRQIYLGNFQGKPCYAAEGKFRDTDSSDFAFHELRTLFDRLEEGLYEIALLGVHLVEWEKTCKFCSKCGETLQPRNDMRAKECIRCKRLEFPRISPAIIVLVEKENTLLLARSPRFPGRFFSVLAGFVNPGESLEDAIHREILEETGIAVKNITYFGSQPWPFPDSLMIGFTAQYESGEIQIDGDEIIEAGWYAPEHLPEIPGKLSIARQLIDRFLDKHPSSQATATSPSTE